MNEKQHLMHRIQMADFALVDAKLYLDTHPCDMDAMEYYREQLRKSTMLREEYEDQYGPITPRGSAHEDSWCWALTPWPWEMEA